MAEEVFSGDGFEGCDGGDAMVMTCAFDILDFMVTPTQLVSFILRRVRIVHVKIKVKVVGPVMECLFRDLKNCRGIRFVHVFYLTTASYHVQ